MGSKFKITIDIEADRMLSVDSNEYTFYVDEISNLRVLDENGKEIIPSHDCELEELMEEILAEIYDYHIAKYGEIHPWPR